jgi:hypothetical protein
MMRSDAKVVLECEIYAKLDYLSFSILVVILKRMNTCNFEAQEHCTAV